MPKSEKQYEKEWSAICNGEPVITVGYFDENDQICEINEVDLRDVGSLDQIASDMDLKRFYDSVINC